MIKYFRSVSLVLLFFIITLLISPSFYQRLHAFEFHRVTYKSCSGMVPYINQIDDTKPYGMNGSLSSCPASCIMIAAYYGGLNKWVDSLGPSGYGFYICNPYEIKSHTFSDLSADQDGKNFAGAYGFLVKDRNICPPAEIVSDFLRAHSVVTTYYKPSGTLEEIFKLLKNEIVNNHPIFLQTNDRNIVITGYGYSSDQNDLLLIKDPANPKLHSIYLSQIEPSYFLFTRSISYDDPVKVVSSEIEVREKPKSNNEMITRKQLGSTGIIKLHPDLTDLWINEKTNDSIQSWFYVQWEDGVKGFSRLGKGIINYLEPYTKVIEDPEKNKITITLIVHEGKIEGPIVKDGLIFATDGKGKTIKQSTNQLGYAILKGEKGNWSFTISKQDYFEKTLTETIEQTEDKHVFILKKPKTEEDLKLPNLICKEVRMSGGIAVEGKQFYINPVVQNIGKTIAEQRSHVKVLLSPKNDTNLSDDIMLGIAEVSTLKLNEKCIATVFYHQFPSIPGSNQRDFTMWPVFVVDCNQEVDESDENNTFKSNVSIIIKMKPRDPGRCPDSPCENVPTEKPTLISPINEILVTNPVSFSWEGVGCASFYFIDIMRKDGSLVVGDGCIAGTSYTSPVFLDTDQNDALTYQTYKWTVTPWNQWGPGPRSDYGFFRIPLQKTLIDWMFFLK